jgi:hypothetical protein
MEYALHRTCLLEGWRVGRVSSYEGCGQLLEHKALPCFLVKCAWFYASTLQTQVVQLVQGAQHEEHGQGIGFV